ncbi:chorion peroxidase-like [Anopheles ziemanni]|uniref:chorion peroxidase-like n=1 Tax=Anopheles coustani TaxID=139045 RepID=UPI00265B69C0|nr:chorion peroxidase-like [Anopheles coustani]XP_058173934.1 chorion peroxidase-like [Anopheles ziemanni]
MEQEALERAVAEMQNNEVFAMNPANLMHAGEFDDGLFQTKPIKGFEELGVRRSLTTQKFLQALAQKYGVCEIKNLLEGRCYSNATLTSCKGTEQIKCDRSDPFRSYDGSCNNLKHPTWGRRGNPLKYSIAPCFSDLVSKPARSKSGKPLPRNRVLISDIVKVLDETSSGRTSKMSMHTVFFSEVVNGDMIGRATKRTRKATNGFRGCLAGGSDRSSNVSPLTNPLRVQPNDRYYGPLGVRCLNFNPQEKANDRCELKYAADRNLESSYLDLSILYTDEPQYDEQGKLKLFQCGTSEAIALSEPISVQKIAVSGLFGYLHNYCVDRVALCPKGSDRRSVRERCRALTIGVYQKIIYEQLLPFLFGEELYERCGLNCEYNPHVESAVSQVYKSGPGRFQHTWIPDQMMYKPGGKSQWLPFNVFFHDHEKFDCTATLAGLVESPIQVGRLSSAYANIFYTENGVHGTCLTCIDLGRNREAGLCPLVTLKHYIEQLIGEESTCYNTFEDLRDMFSPELTDLLKQYYESPSDVDVLLSILEKRRYPGSKLPKFVSQVTCLEFKRLKCTDRLFYTWNPHLGEGARHLIKALDFTALFALFTDMPDVPLEPFIVDGPRVAASDVRSYVKSLDYLFCHL